GRTPRWRLGLLLVILAGVAVGAGAYAGLAGGDGDAGAPDQVVREYLTAWASYDCEVLLDLQSERSLEEGGGRRKALDDCEDTRANAEQDELSDDALADIIGTLETTSVGGGRATVTYAAGPEPTGELDPATIEVTLVDEGGAWKVDDVALVPGRLPDGSPQAAARDYAQAVLDGDCDMVLAVVTADALTALGDTPDEQASECERIAGAATGPSDARLGPILRESEQDGEAIVGVTIVSESYEAGNN